MAEEIKPPAPAAPPGAGALPPVAGSSAPHKLGAPPVAAHAASSVPSYGGNRGGKKRADGLVPGSAEAIEADRKKDAERKKRTREAAHRLAPAPALPAALPAAVDPGAPVANGEAGFAPLASTEQASIPWEPDLLKDLVEEGIEYSERRRVQKFKEAATAAQLPEPLIRQIGQDAQFVPAFKSTTIKTGPRAIAKILNRMGISAQYSDEGLFLFSVASIWFQGWRLESRLEEMIEQVNKDRATAAAKAAAKP
jgi:hypothetical protein